MEHRPIIEFAKLAHCSVNQPNLYLSRVVEAAPSSPQRRRASGYEWKLAGGAILLLLFIIAAPLPSVAATVRGRLDRVDGYGRHYPAPYIAVTLKSQTGNRTSPAHTDVQGMYYFNNIPRGKYSLEVWLSKDPKAPPKVFNIVVATEPYTDIRPIVVP